METILKRWLLIVMGLIASIVIIGGITRLTGSGLSMVDWQPIMGSIPPLSSDTWEQTFNAYKQSPEFQQINSTMTLSEFKFIFFWEYLHRMLGRLIGLAAFLPFVIFSIQKKLSRAFTWRWLGIITLIGCQGLMGWYMVKSGLVDIPHVSHFRLAAHLSLAFLIFCLVLREYLYLVFPGEKLKLSRNMIITRLILVGISIQIVYGAFTAGLNGGHYYNTYPKMGPDWFPDAALMYAGGIMNNALNNPIMIQWIHRWLGVIIVIGVIYMWRQCQQSQHHLIQYSGLLLLTAVSFQFLLGIITLLTGVWLPVAIAHQFGALVLLASGTLLAYLFGHQQERLQKNDV